MGVDRTDYLMWGAKVDPDAVEDKFDEYEAEIEGAPGARFDLVYDSMCGKYAIAGRIVAASAEHEGLEFKEITPSDLAADPDVVNAVTQEFPDAGPFSLFLFSHYS